MKVQSQRILALILVFLLTACATSLAASVEPASPTNSVTLKISGSGSTTAILTAIQPAFEADVPGYQLEVLPGSGTGGGVKGIISGILDVAAMARPPKDEEVAQDVLYTELGQAGIAIVTHPQVNVTNLTTNQVRAIFTGDITNWSAVGGADAPIILYVRDEEDSNTKALRSAIVGDESFAAGEAQVLTSQNDMLIAVAGTPSSIGVATWPTALAGGSSVQAVSIDGIAPGDKVYPMLSVLGIGYLTNRQADVQPLLDWLGSEQGRTALQELDMIIQ